MATTGGKDTNYVPIGDKIKVVKLCSLTNNSVAMTIKHKFFESRSRSSLFRSKGPSHGYTPTCVKKSSQVEQTFLIHMHGQTKRPNSLLSGTGGNKPSFLSDLLSL